MPNFIQQQQVTTANEFVARVRHAAVKSALAIAAEPPETALHELRVALAGAVLAEPDRFARLFAVGCVTNTLVNNDAPDDSIEFQVISMWGAYQLMPGLGAAPLTSEG